MPYATIDDLVPLRLTGEDLTELTNDDPDATSPDMTVVSAAFAEATGLVDGYCGQRYGTPLQASAMVRAIMLDLVTYALATRRRQTKPNETWSERRDQAIALLRDVAAGKASLDQPATAAQPQSSSASVTTPTTPLTFNDDYLRGFC